MSDLNGQLARVRFIVCDVDGVLTDGRIFFDGDGRPCRAVHVHDGCALTLWHLAGGMSALVSGLGSPAVEAIAKAWKCAECHLWIWDKASICREMADRRGIALDEMAFLGDDLIDLKALRLVGVGVAVGDAVAEAKAAADLVTDAPGGRGALRELVYWILRAQGRLDEVIADYGNRRNGPQ